MSRSGYTDECDGWDLIRWRGAVNSAIKGKRGQQFLKELLDALDAMPEKRLIAEELEDGTGNYCAIGTVGAKRCIDMSDIDPYDREKVAEVFNIAPALAAEIVFTNDDRWYGTESPEHRWVRVREWVERQITNNPTPAVGEA